MSQQIRTILQNMGYTNPHQMIIHAQAMYGPLRPVTNQASTYKAVQHVINASQEFQHLPLSIRQQKLQERKKQTQKYSKIRKDLGTHLISMGIATSPAHADALIQYVEHLAKTKLQPVNLDKATAFFFKYYYHPQFQNGFMEYVTNHSVQFYEYLLQLSPGHIPQGLSQSQIHKLKKISGKQYLSGKGQVQACPICTQDFVQDDVIVQLPCHHIFHQEQIKKWLKTNKTCPMCKIQL